MKYLRLDIGDNKWWVNRDNILMTVIREIVDKAKPGKEGDIIGSKGKVKWAVDLIMPGTAPFMLFNSKEEAERWQKDFVINGGEQ